MASPIALPKYCPPRNFYSQNCSQTLAKVADESVFSPDSGVLAIRTKKKKRMGQCQDRLLTCVKRECEGDRAIFAL